MVLTDNVALKLRIKPTKKQEKINQIFSGTRYVYNALLNEYEKTGKIALYTICYSKDKLLLQEVDKLSYANIPMNLRSSIKNHKSNPKHFGKT